MITFQACRRDVLHLVEAALEAVDPYRAVRRYLKRDGRSLAVDRHTIDLDAGRVFIVAVGKAAVPMAEAAVAVLDEDVYAACALTKKDGGAEDAGQKSGKIRVYAGAHPVSDESSVRATAAVLELLAETAGGDLVLCLISGGASALLTQPVIPLAAWQALTDALLASGCTINELNGVRRQLDRVKGGGLARAAAPAACFSLILSDVIGNPLAAIGSGPTVPSQETAAEALAILARYGIENEAARRYLRAKAAAAAPDSESLPQQLEHLIVGDVRVAAEAAREAAQRRGFETQILTTYLEGEAREAGRFAAALARDMPASACWILGGETTVTLRGDGFGGRNQEVALATAIGLAGQPNAAVATFATDGDDGPTQAAGAIVTGETASLARTHDLDPRAYLDRNDSGTFFRELDALSPSEHLIKTGLTGTNVNDLIFILKYAD